MKKATILMAVTNPKTLLDSHYLPPLLLLLDALTFT